MQRLAIGILAFSALLMLCLVDSGSSQVTFSKGWGPGKRSFYSDRLSCNFNSQPIMNAYYTLLSELRQLVTCETQRLIAYSKAGGDSSSNPLETER